MNERLDSIGAQLAGINDMIEALGRMVASQGGRIDRLEIKIGRLKRLTKDCHANQMMAIDAVLRRDEVIPNEI